MRAVERRIEALLWNSRYIVIVAVVSCLLVSLVLYGMVAVQALELPSHLVSFVNDSLGSAERAKLYTDSVARIAGLIDGFLFATILLIFAMGLYELFIGKIEVAERSELAKHILLIGSIDDLKDRLAKVIFLILIVRYFEYALHNTYDSGLDLLYLALGIALIAGALWLTGRHEPSHDAGEKPADAAAGPTELAELPVIRS